MTDSGVEGKGAAGIRELRGVVELASSSFFSIDPGSLPIAGKVSTGSGDGDEDVELGRVVMRLVGVPSVTARGVRFGEVRIGAAGGEAGSICSSDVTTVQYTVSVLRLWSF